MAIRAIGLVGLLALAGLLGCGPTSSPGAGSPQDSPHAASPATAPSDRATVTVTLPPEPPGIRLSFIQQRFDEGTRRADITVMNYSGHPMRVRAVGLDWPGYPGLRSPGPTWCPTSSPSTCATGCPCRRATRTSSTPTRSAWR